MSTKTKLTVEIIEYPDDGWITYYIPLMQFKCGYCSARAGQPCKQRTGRLRLMDVAPYFHKSRYDQQKQAEMALEGAMP